MEKRKVLALGIAGLSLALAASITSTVAWYTGSSYLAITDINITLENPELSISTDGVHFSNKVRSDELFQVSTFHAVSSVFSNEWIEERKETPIFKEGYSPAGKYVSKYSDNAVEGFFSQTLYLKSTSYNYVTLDANQSLFTPDEEGNKELWENAGFMNKMRSRFPDLSEEELKAVVLEKLNSVVKSMRFSILVLDDNSEDEYDDYKYFIYDPNKSEETLLGGILDSTDSGFYDTYNHKEILYGDVYSNDENKTAEQCVVYDTALEEATNIFTRENMTCFNANNAKGDEKVNFSLSENNGLRIRKENSLSKDEVETKLLIPVSPNKSQRIVLSFYQEGWDKDNTNFIVYSHFFTNVQFMIAPVEPRF